MKVEKHIKILYALAVLSLIAVVGLMVIVLGFINSNEPTQKSSITLRNTTEIPAQDNVARTTDFELSYQKVSGSLSLNFANVGVNSAGAVTVSLPNQQNFAVTGSNFSVLGNLNPGDYTSAIFQLSKVPGGSNNLNVDIQYTDTSGQRHMTTKSLIVELNK